MRTETRSVRADGQKILQDGVVLSFIEVRPASHFRDDEREALRVVLFHAGKGMALDTAIQIEPAAFVQRCTIGMLPCTGLQKRRGNGRRDGWGRFAARKKCDKTPKEKETGDEVNFHQKENPKMVLTWRSGSSPELVT